MKDFDIARVNISESNFPCSIFFISDIHRDSPSCAVDVWQKSLSRIRKTKNAYIIGVGDYLDFCSASEKKKLLDDDLHDSTAHLLDKWAMAEVNGLMKEIKSSGAQMLGMVDGNHYWKFQDGTTSTQRMCDAMGCAYLGQWMGVLGLFAMRRDGKQSRAHLNIAIHHGKGGGKRAGTSVNNVEDMSHVIDADIYVMGHDHRCSATPARRLTCQWERNTPAIVERQMLFIRSGAFLKCYETGKRNYGVKPLYPPAHLGCVQMDVRLHSNHKGQRKLLCEAKAIST